jgi:hypothetical protein
MILGENYTQNRVISPLEFEKLLMEKENQKSDYTLSTFWKADHHKMYLLFKTRPGQSQWQGYRPLQD